MSDMLGNGWVSVWIWPTPRDGEIVPDHPPVELTDYLVDDSLTLEGDSPEEGPCARCERCTWNPGPDCGRAEHPHCETCGHCQGLHA